MTYYITDGGARTKRSGSHASNVLPAARPEAAPVPDRCLFAAFDFFGEQHAQHLGVLPPLRGRGGDHLGRGSADVWQPHAAQQLLELGGQRAAERVA